MAAVVERINTLTQRARDGVPVVLVADAHTTHDKARATGAQIRAHRNATLCNISSFGPRIEAQPTAEVVFAA